MNNEKAVALSKICDMGVGVVVVVQVFVNFTDVLCMEYKLVHPH